MASSRVCDIAVAAQADIDRIRLGKSRLPAGVRAVAIGAIARGSRMLNFCCLDQLGFIVVAGYAQSLGIGLRENYFPVFGRSWQTSHCLSANGGCVNFAISLGAADSCGS